MKSRLVFLSPFALFIGFFFAVSPLTVGSQETALRTDVVRVAKSPATITRCEYALGYGGVSLNIVNRTRHDLTGFDVRFQFYDVENTLVAQAIKHWDPNPLLTPGDTGTYSDYGYTPSMPEPPSALRRVTCRLNAATFTGRASWSYGHTWPEPLTPLEDESNSSNGGADRSEDAPVSARPSLQFAVMKAWNDVYSGVLIVHDQLQINGGSSNVTISPANFQITMNLTSGAQKSFGALQRGAPTYQKFNPLNTSQTITAYEVDPAVDLGAMQSLVVPAHGVVLITASFVVTEPVADPTANRNVSYR